MDKNRKLRTPLRTAFTKAVGAITALFNAEDVPEEELQAAMDAVESKAQRIAELDQKIIEDMHRSRRIE